LIISWGYKSLKPSHSIFLDNHQFQGTRDYAAFLTIPIAIDFMKQYHWEKVSMDCKQLTQRNASRFCELMGTEPLTAISDDFIGQLFSIPIKIKFPEKLHDILYETFRVQVPVLNHEGNSYLRYSIQGFNKQSDLDQLYNALSELGPDRI
jgi:isopenicillin-N epimerase